MAVGPAEAAKLITTVVLAKSAPRSTRTVLEEIICTHGWFAGADAADKADQWLDRFINRLEFASRDAHDSGTYVGFAFNSSGTDYIQGYCFCEPGDTPEVISSKEKRAQTLGTFATFSRLSANEFEYLSGKILGLMKVEKPYVSQRSADQGIDFFGRVHFGSSLRATLLNEGAEKHFYIWLVGQAKHYPISTVSTSEIRELVGSVEFARAKVFAGSVDPLSDLQVRLCDPIFYLFFTTGRFTRDSESLMRRSGVLSFDGMQIAQFLADRGIGQIGGAFDEAAFMGWIKS